MASGWEAHGENPPWSTSLGAQHPALPTPTPFQHPAASPQELFGLNKLDVQQGWHLGVVAGGPRFAVGRGFP